MTTSAIPPTEAGPQPADGSNDYAITPAVLLRALRKHWLLISITAIVCVVGALLYTAREKRIYEAVATIQLDPQRLLPLGDQLPAAYETGSESYWSNQEYFATQHQVMTSRKVAGLVVKKLGLNRDGGFLRLIEPGHVAPAVDVPVEQAAEVLRSRLKVKPIQDSRLVQVRYTDVSPERARRILSGVIDTYVDQNLDATLDSSGKAAEWLDEQMFKLKAELEGQEMELHDFKLQNNLLSVSYDDQTNMLRAEIQQLNRTLTDLKERREQLAARVAVLQKITPEDPADIPQTELASSNVLNELRTEYVHRKQTLQGVLAAGKGENHPEAMTARAQHDTARTGLQKELQNIKNGVGAELAAVTQEFAGLTVLYEAAKKQALALNINELKYSRLRRSKENTERIFGVVLERASESGLSKALPFNNVRVLDRPLQPTEPVSPNRTTNLAFGVALGLLLGLAGAVGRELMDRSVRDAEDAEQELGIPVLGSLPDLAHAAAQRSYYVRRKPRAPVPELGRPELVVHSHPKSAIAEAARAVRTNLLFMSPDKPFRALLVTSPGAAEGKTTVASCIAIAMAQAGQRVCLLDCDLRKPRIHEVFGIDSPRGLTNVLINPGDLDASLQETEIPNLTVLGAGPIPPNPADLMHSESFAKLLETLSIRFDRIVIDSPPAALVTDAVIISTRVDATLMVVRALRTKRDAARRALRALRAVSAYIPGFVLNATISMDRYEYSSYSYSKQPPAQPTSV